MSNRELERGRSCWSWPGNSATKGALIGFAALILLCGCQMPVVPVRNMQYAVAYSVDGQSFQTERSYKCYYEDVNWISERGAEWHARDKDQLISIAGVRPDGTRFVVQPVDKRMGNSYKQSKYTCWNAREFGIASEVFFRSKEDPRTLQGFDAKRIAGGDRTVRIDQSLLHLRSNGAGIFESYVAIPIRGHIYYTISTKVLSGADIDSADLRDYINSRKSIWLKEGISRPFVGRTRDSVSSARRYEETNPYLYFPEAGVELSCEYTKEGWVFSRDSDKAITWLPSAVEDGRGPIIPDSKVPTTWIKFGTTRIEIPLRQYSAIQIYDPRTDELIVFYVYRTAVADDLL